MFDFYFFNYNFYRRSLLNYINIKMIILIELIHEILFPLDSNKRFLLDTCITQAHQNINNIFTKVKILSNI